MLIDFAERERQKLIDATPAKDTYEQKLAKAKKWMGKRWCLHPKSTLVYKRSGV